MGMISASPESRYCACAPAGKRKSLGQYFTPQPIAERMVRWACRGAPVPSFLDPAAGLGLFIRCYLAGPGHEKPGRIVGYELDPSLRRITRELSGLPRGLSLRGDYLREHDHECFDAIVCNPPYIKHRLLPKAAKLARKQSRVLNRPLGALNSYCFFLLKSLSELKPGGRCAYLVPSEFLSADFGVPVKRLLVQEGWLRALICIDPRIPVFEGALTTSVVLLCERSPCPREIDFIWIEHPGGLDPVFDALDRPGCADDRRNIKGAYWRRIAPQDLDPERKWQNPFPHATMPAQKLIPLSLYGHCARGIATGANDFFMLSARELAEHGLKKSEAKPCIAKAAHVGKEVFTQRDFLELREGGKKCYLLDLGAPPSARARSYLELGIIRGIHLRHLTSHRQPWYAQEKKGPADFWMPVFFRERWRVVRNDARLAQLTAFHGFYLNKLGRRYKARLFAYLNSRSCRSGMDVELRRYGGGLNKLEPKDVERLRVPDFRTANPALRPRCSRRPWP